MIEKIEADLKSALKQKNETVVMSLRNLKAEIKNSELEKRKTLGDEEILQVILRKVKQHKDSIESFQSGNRPDLVEIEEKQMAVLNQYLPPQLSEEEVRDMVKQVIGSMNAQVSDFGKVMKEITAKTRGRADGGMVSRIVKEELK